MFAPASRLRRRLELEAVPLDLHDYLAEVRRIPLRIWALLHHARRLRFRDLIVHGYLVYGITQILE